MASRGRFEGMPVFKEKRRSRRRVRGRTVGGGLDRSVWLRSGDSLKAHRSQLVRQYLDSTGGDFQVTFLPPDLNPVECLRAWPERHALANCCPADLHELKHTARARLQGAQRRPSIITACWKHAGLQ